MDDSLEISINDTEEDYIYEYDLDESLATFNWSELGPSLFVFSVTFIVGILGNSLILVAVLRHTHVKSSPVNVFLASLASADLLLILVCLPLKVAKLFSYSWTMGVVSCKILYYMQSVSGICSVLNLTALSIERYYVIVHPLKAQYLCTISKAKRTVFATWLAAFILAIPILLVQVHMEVGVRFKAYWCVRDFDSPIWWQLQEVYFLFVILIVPTCVMGFSYGKIIVEICKVVKQRYHLTQSSATERKTSEVQTQQQIEMTPFQKVSEGAEVPALAQSQGNITEEHEIKTEKEEPINQPKMDNDTKQVVRMLISIVITFVICWGPLLIFNVLQSFEIVGNFLIGMEKHLKSIFSLLAYFNSCLNPIIYGFMSKSFRQSFVAELRSCCCRYNLQRVVNDPKSQELKRNAQTTIRQNGSRHGSSHVRINQIEEARPLTVTDERLNSTTEVTSLITQPPTAPPAAGL